MTDLQNCGACGDRVEYGSKHECWVIEKIYTQETILETCPFCFEPIRETHWRCEETRRVKTNHEDRPHLSEYDSMMGQLGDV